MSRADRLDGWQEPPPIVISEREARDALSDLIRGIEAIPRSELSAWWTAMNKVSRLPDGTASLELRKAAGCWLRLAHLVQRVHDQAHGAISVQAAEAADERREAA